MVLSRRISAEGHNASSGPLHPHRLWSCFEKGDEFGGRLSMSVLGQM